MRSGLRLGLLLYWVSLCAVRPACWAGEDGLDDLLDEGLEERTPKVLFYAPLDGEATGRTGKWKIRNLVRDYDQERVLVYAKGAVGKAMLTQRTRFLHYPAEEILNRETGTLAFWFRWDPTKKTVGRNTRMVNGFLGAFNAGLFVKPDNQWHAWVITWDCKKGQLRVFADGEEVAKQRLRARCFDAGTLCLGRGMPGHLDEVYVFDLPLDTKAMQAGVARVKQGKPAWPTGAALKPTAFRYPLRIQTKGKKRPPLPQGVDWALRALETTATRRRYDLNGYWRAQPFGTHFVAAGAMAAGQANTKKADYTPKEKPWGYARLPGSWRPHGNLLREGGMYDGANLKRIMRWQGVSINQYPVAWLERDVNVPDLAAGEGVYLIVHDVMDQDPFDVYVNDAPVGTVLQRQLQEFNLTPHLETGAIRLSMLAGKPYGRHVTKDRSGETIWLPSGLSMPLYLEVRKSPKLGFRRVIPVPRFRDKALIMEFRVDNPGGTKKELKASCVVKILGSDKTVELGPQPFTLSGAKSERLRVSLPWADPVLWFPDDPKLLTASLRIHDGKALLDESFPIRFGFREVWTAAGDLWLNGVRLQVRGQCHGVRSGDPNVVRQNIARLRWLNYNGEVGYFLGPAPLADTLSTLRVADEEGLMMSYKLYPRGYSRAAQERSLEDYLLLFRNHPCVITYNRCRYGYHGPAHGSPISLGRTVKEEEKEKPAYKRDQALWDLVRSVDPFLPFAFYQEGVVGDYRSYMQYIGPATPIQTREEWPRYWAAHKPAPFFGLELDMGLYMYYYKWQKNYNRTKQPFENNAEPHDTEHAARYFGNQAYERQTLEWVQRLERHMAEEEPYGLPLAPNYLHTAARLAERSMRAWRTYGISYLIHDCLHIERRTQKTMTILDKAYRRGNRPFLAYIGGDKDFVRKDHAYTTGETVAKQIVLLNNCFHAVEAKVSWQVLPQGGGKPMATGSEILAVKAGALVMKPLAFPAPDAKAKTSYTVSLAVEEDGKRCEDTFAIQVFPKAPALALDEGLVYLVDKTGGTAKVLEQAGVGFQKVALDQAGWDKKVKAGMLLVIGRKSLPADPALHGRLYALVQEGLHILCFEQTTSTLFGLRNDDPNTRHAFVAAPQHPVVKGLSDEDFRDWRGASDILEPYPDYRTGPQYGLMTHKGGKSFFGQSEWEQWSLNGTVAAFHIEKPQTGRFRVLLSSGFDLLYSPLLELHPGKGLIVLSQLDVTNRYGRDPVATRVVNRLLRYAAQPARAPAAPLMCWGSAYWSDLFGRMGVDVSTSQDLKGLGQARAVLLGLEDPKPRGPKKKITAADLANKARTDGMHAPAAGGGDELDALLEEETSKGKTRKLPAAVAARVKDVQAQAGAIGAFLERGGVLIVPWVLNPETLAWLPFKAKLTARPSCKADPGRVPELAGLSMSELYFREGLNLPGVENVSKGGARLENGWIAVVPHGKGKVVFCQLYPDYFHNPWQRTKVLRVWATLLTNLGVGCKSVKDTAKAEALSAHYYETKPLDFNPDQHTSW